MKKKVLNPIIRTRVIMKPESLFLVLEVLKNRLLIFSMDLPIQTTGWINEGSSPKIKSIKIAISMTMNSSTCINFPHNIYMTYIALT